MGQTAEPLCPRRTHMEQMLICLSIALIAGLLMSRLAKAVNLPAVTSYLVAGLLLGASAAWASALAPWSRWRATA